MSNRGETVFVIVMNLIGLALIGFVLFGFVSLLGTMLKRCAT